MNEHHQESDERDETCMGKSQNPAIFERDGEWGEGSNE